MKKFNLISIGLIWLDFVWVLHREWAFSEQYSYGFFVPVLALVLIFLNQLPRINEDVVGRKWIGLDYLVGLWFALIVPLKIILVANPEWRLALWSYGLVVFATSLALCFRAGFRPFSNTILSAHLLMLMAIPWPVFLEQPIVTGLMESVAIIVVEVLNLIGVFAERHGNVIFLSNATVGIEEACSGIQSLQSTLMAAFFVGSFFRWHFKFRLLFILVGIMVSFSLNVLRSFVLTWTAVSKGEEVMQSIHDTMGYVVLFGAYLVLFFIGWLISKISDEGGKPLVDRPATEFSQSNLSFRLVVGILFFSYLFSFGWYKLRNERDSINSNNVEMSIDLGKIPYDIQKLEISETVRSILRYSQGEHLKWVDSDGLSWTLFFFKWEENTVSSHVNVHRPDVCLPSAGYRLSSTEKPIELEKRPLQFEVSQYEIGNRKLHVFYGVWEDGFNEDLYLGSGWKDRLRQAWQGRKINDRYSVQVIVSKENNEEIIRRKFKELIKAILINDNELVLNGQEKINKD